MQLGFAIALISAAALTQTAALSLLIDGFRPDLVLLVVLAWSMLRGFTEGTICGVAGGLMLDLMSAAPFGLHTALMGLIGAFTALGESNLYRGNLLLFLVTAASATVALHGGSLLVLQLAGQQTVGLARFAHYVVPTAALNAALLPLIFSLVQRTARALAGWRQLEL